MRGEQSFALGLNIPGAGMSVAPPPCALWHEVTRDDGYYSRMAWFQRKDSHFVAKVRGFWGPSPQYVRCKHTVGDE